MCANKVLVEKYIKWHSKIKSQVAIVIATQMNIETHSDNAEF